MIKQPLLTIVIPTLNRAYCVGRAIESALAQKSDKIEIIVSDNGSRDDTQAVINKYNDIRLKKFYRQDTISAAAHGNFLIEQARGKFFLGLSDDDYIEPDFSEKILALFEKYPNLSFAYTGCWVHYQNIAVPAAVGPVIETGADFVRAHYQNIRHVCWCACVTRVEHLKKFSPIPEEQFFGDMFFWSKIAFLGPVGCVNERLSNYILMSDNLTSAHPVPKWAKESEDLANSAYIKYCNIEKSRLKHFSLHRHIMRYLAISVANQFVWNVLRNTSKLQLLNWLPHYGKYFLWAPGTLIQVIAALFVPKEKLRKLILSHAKKLRKQRL